MKVISLHHQILFLTLPLILELLITLLKKTLPWINHCIMTPFLSLRRNYTSQIFFLLVSLSKVKIGSRQRLSKTEYLIILQVTNYFIETAISIYFLYETLVHNITSAAHREYTLEVKWVIIKLDSTVYSVRRGMGNVLSLSRGSSV